MDDLDQTLDKFQVPAPERAEVVAIVQSTYTDIVTPEPAPSNPTGPQSYPCLRRLRSLRSGSRLAAAPGPPSRR